MNWTLLINDDNCKRDLQKFLRKHKASVISKERVEVRANKDLDARTNEGVQNRPNILAVNSSHVIHLIKVNELLHCKSEQNYTQLYFSNGTVLTTTKTLKELDEKLSSRNFVRIHQSHLVNMFHIERFDKMAGKIVLSNGTKIPVATRKRENLIRNIERI